MLVTVVGMVFDKHGRVTRMPGPGDVKKNVVLVMEDRHRRRSCLPESMSNKEIKAL